MHTNSNAFTVAVLSTDGDTAVPGASPPASSGILVTKDGTISFGSATATGGRAILLNGANLAGGYGVKLYLANGGKLYVRTADSDPGTTGGKVYQYVGGGWSKVAQNTVPA